jgi:PAS domain S-box-containing protein
MEVWCVLIVDDDEDDYVLTREMLKQARGRVFQLEWAPTFAAGRQLLEAKQYHAVLVDYDLGARSGIELIREAAARGYPAPLILYTGRGSIEVDVEAMEAGASLYLTKGDVNSLSLERFIRYAIDSKQMDRELDRRLQERSIILESIQDGLFGLDREWRITYINTRAAQNMNMQPEDLVGKNIWETFPRLIGTVSEEHYRRVMQERVSVQFEMQGVYLGRWYTINVYPSSEGISIYWQDITQHKWAEDALRASEERFKKAFNANPTAQVISRQADGLIQDVNDGFLELFGFTREAVIGRTSTELNMFANPADRDEALHRLKAEKRLRNFEVAIKTRNGEVRAGAISVEMIEIEGEACLLTVIQDRGGFV